MSETACNTAIHPKMSDLSEFLDQSLQISESVKSEGQQQHESQDGTPISQPSNSENQYEGYAEFIRQMIRHNVQILGDAAAIISQDLLGDIGQGGTFVVRTGKLRRAITGSKSRPFILKSSTEALNKRHPIATEVVPQGMHIVSKHVNFERLKHKGVRSSEFLRSLETEAVILSHPIIRGIQSFPSLIGIGVEISPYDTGESPQTYPFLIMELGRQGNFEELLRDMWHRILQSWAQIARLGRTANNSDFDKVVDNLRLPLGWSWKLDAAQQISEALRVLHYHGVVHGDVKMANTLCINHGSNISVGELPDGWRRMINWKHGVAMAQLGDFGSSIFLSEIPEGHKVRLTSHSPPWNAPETSREIVRSDLVKTDIYSFGLLFARIMMLGDNPFDDTFHLLTDHVLSFDVDEVEAWREDDMMADYLLGKIADLDVYDDEELRIIGIVLNKTVRTAPQDRIESLANIGKFLRECAVLEGDALSR